MDIWTVDSDPKTGGYTHKVRGGAGHSLLVPVVCSVFQALRVSASMFDGRFWWSLHSEPNITQLEVEHGVENARWAYNGRLFAEVAKQRTPIRGTHAGYFQSVRAGDRQWKGRCGVGRRSLDDERPSSASILERWRKLTGRQGHPSDPEFATYLRMSLSTLVLDGQKARLFEQLLTRLAKLIAGEGPADEVANQAHALRLQIEPARFADRLWEAVSTMIDEAIVTSAVQPGARLRAGRPRTLASSRSGARWTRHQSSGEIRIRSAKRSPRRIPARGCRMAHTPGTWWLVGSAITVWCSSPLPGAPLSNERRCFCPSRRVPAPSRARGSPFRSILAPAWSEDRSWSPTVIRLLLPRQNRRLRKEQR